MCIIVVKKENIAFPNKKTLQNCFDNNPDGAGFMYAVNNIVNISKGYETFNKFWKDLQAVRKEYGDNIPYILHFRISTQAHGRMDCTHPFPLSPKMADLRQLKCKTNIGIAHNGIISLTSTWGYGKTITYSDTMQFITDYLSLIIENKDYYKDSNKMKLIERLCDSKLAIMDYTGHIELIGDGFIDDKGIVYSNSSYKERKLKVYTAPATSSSSNWTYGGKNSYYKNVEVVDFNKDYSIADEKDEWDNDYYDEYEKYFDDKTGLYNFTTLDCPVSWGEPYGEDYCEYCKHFASCYSGDDDDDDDKPKVDTK